MIACVCVCVVIRKHKLLQLREASFNLVTEDRARSALLSRNLSKQVRSSCLETCKSIHSCSDWFKKQKAPMQLNKKIS